MTIYQLMVEHEWSYAEGNRIFCETCGIKHRDTAKNPKHRPNCEYARALKALKNVNWSGEPIDTTSAYPTTKASYPGLHYDYGEEP